jgi:hypothetical protein
MFCFLPCIVHTLIGAEPWHKLKMNVQCSTVIFRLQSPNEIKKLQARDTANTNKCTSYFDLLSEGQLYTIIYNKYSDFSFLIVYFPFPCFLTNVV